MKRVLFAASALSLISASALAQDVGPIDATVNATVTPACGVSGDMAGGARTFVLPIGDNGRLSGHDTAGFSTNVMFTAQELFGDGVAWCNGPAKIAVTGAPLRHESNPSRSTDPEAFIGWLDLALRVDATLGFGIGDHRFGANDLNTGGGPMAVAANNRRVELTVNEPFAGQLDGNLLFWGQEDRRFLAGDYSATWTIEITPVN